MTNFKHQTKKTSSRSINMALVLSTFASPETRMTVTEISARTKLTLPTTNSVLNDLEHERKITRFGHRVSAGGSGVVFGLYVGPVAANPFEFRPLRPQRSTVIPIREGGRIAPDLYKDIILTSISSKR
jgi:hypothetical protein